jgi:DNA-binding transcriptional ArsR family regulator
MTTVFEVLADPTRRRIIAHLRAGEHHVGEIVAYLGISQPVASKHLRVLRKAGLVSMRGEAQRRIYALVPERLVELDGWLEPFRALWTRG